MEGRRERRGRERDHSLRKMAPVIRWLVTGLYTHIVTLPGMWTRHVPFGPDSASRKARNCSTVNCAMFLAMFVS